MAQLFAAGQFCGSPLAFSLLIGVASVLVWMAFAPAHRKPDVIGRLDEYLSRPHALDEIEMSRPFAVRAVLPVFRRVLGILGRLAPKRNLASTQETLLRAGEPGGLSVLDFLGLRLLTMILLGGGYALLQGQSLPFSLALRNTIIAGGLGYFGPTMWLRMRVKRRQREIRRALPDALDMLTIGVEAGLAFESALLKVGERWDNALTRELRRTVSEMRVGVARDVSLQRLADRAGVADLGLFVAVLIQSSQLGVSIGPVLHSQAAEMRSKRRQRAEELARQASVKMVFPLVLFLFPAFFVVVLGPMIPQIISAIGNMPFAP